MTSVLKELSVDLASIDQTHTKHCGTSYQLVDA